MTWVPEPGTTERQIRKELDRQAVLFEEKVINGASANGNMRFADFAEKYMTEYAQLYLKPKTIATYTENLRRINQAIGHIRLCDLRTGHINSFYQNLQEKGIRSRTTAACKINLWKHIGTQRGALTAFARKAGVSRSTVNQALEGQPVSRKSAEAISQAAGMKPGKVFNLTTHAEPLAPSSVISYHRTLSSILSRAVKWGYIQSNPADAAEKPSLGCREAAFLEEAGARQLLELLQAEPIRWRAVITFDLMSGLHRGLRWQDVDLGSGVPHIVQTSNCVSGTGVYIGTPKTTDSDRYLKVSRTAILILLEYKIWQDDMKSKVGDAWECTAEDDRIVTNEVERPMFPTSLTQWMGKFIKRTGLPSSSVHSLRHTYASLLIAEGTPLVVVSRNLGHAQVSTTSDIYSHVIASAEAKAAQMTDKFLEDIHLKFTPETGKEGDS